MEIKGLHSRDKTGRCYIFELLFHVKINLIRSRFPFVPRDRRSPFPFLTMLLRSRFSDLSTLVCTLFRQKPWAPALPRSFLIFFPTLVRMHFLIFFCSSFKIVLDFLLRFCSFLYGRASSVVLFSIRSVSTLSCCDSLVASSCRGTFPPFVSAFLSFAIAFSLEYTSTLFLSRFALLLPTRRSPLALFASLQVPSYAAVWMCRFLLIR